MTLPDTIYLQGKELYKVVRCGNRSGIDYKDDLWEIWLNGNFCRHATEIEVGFLKAGVVIGLKNKEVYGER